MTAAKAGELFKCFQTW